MKISRLVLVGALLGAASGAWAQMAYDVGASLATETNNKVRKASVQVGLENDKAPLWQGQNVHVGLRQEAELSYWDTRQSNNRSMYSASYTPVFRLYSNAPLESGQFFAEAGVGLSLISRVQIRDDKRFSTAFNFNDLVGAGYRWGTKNTKTVGVRLQHLSNASIKQPNPGINFVNVYYQYRY